MRRWGGWGVVALAALGCRHGAAPAPAACPTAPVVAASAEQLAALRGCARLPALTIRSAAPIDLSALTGLEAVDGDLVIGPTLALSSVGLPALRQVGGRFAVVANGAATGVFAPALTAVGALEITDDAALVTLSLPRLAEVTGDATVRRAAALETIDASALARVGGDLTVEAPAATVWLGARPAVAGATAVRAPGWDGL
ncbi:MAG: hypothetical protein IPH44_16850 [Myxococcales bacterium]|nr:hypothetical protein [Myxococcales bacterium]MBK7196571.1 hypothetical protein [Myxococcales bacterium]MBP6845662.1 hypothetical protein [Kofleriaceae bacterium]